MKNDEWYIRSTFQPPPSSLQYPQRYYNQNIARNWANSINLGEKSQNCSFCLKIDKRGISKMLFLFSKLVFWISNHFWANLGRKNQSCLFYLRTGIYDILEVLIPNLDLDFRICEPQIHFWPNLGQKSQYCPFCLKIGTHGILEELIPNHE